MGEDKDDVSRNKGTIALLKLFNLAREYLDPITVQDCKKCMYCTVVLRNEVSK